MIHFIHNIGDYFASNYFDEDFSKKVIEKSGYGTDAIKQLDQAMARLKPEYFKLKQKFIENHLRIKDKINLSHAFHTQVLTALGYDDAHTHYEDLFHINDKNVLPVRHILYRGDEVHLMVMEMHALIKTGEEEPDGLFEQSYNVANEEEATAKAQKYHRSQWADVFTVPDGLSISPMIINQAINELFLLPTHRRPKFILLCGGNQYFLLEAEKWFRGSYLQLDLEALFDDASVHKDYYAVFYLLLGKELLAPAAEMILMEQLDEDAHKAAYEVTKDLKEGVIHAVESLANEAVQYLKQQGVDYHEIDANHLKNDCLSMVYRLLFLFYAEAREDLDILPSNDEVYERGYSLEMLRDLELVPLVTESSINGYFFHDSLFRLFDLLNKGYREEEGASKTFKIRHLDSPMFNTAELHYLNRVKMRNAVWQDVICELSLSKRQKGKNRGRISYANLGINQLGSVYESLLAFRGFLAETDYIEVHRKKKKGESSEKVARTDGSYLVPRHRLSDFAKDEIFYTEKEAEDELKVIPQGSFIYRLSGRDRQKSASYYTPEVLTQTTVKYTLKPILERLEKGEMQAPDLLKLKILEPAMGAAAFHNEVINQLAQAYLTYRQQELNKRVDPNKYQEELQRIKAYVALNNVYGVDLNPTAVELGKLSLWLNVIHKDMQTPFFGYRLGVGNAVVGSWLKVFKYKDFSFEPTGQKGFVKKEWWNTGPKHLQFGKKGMLRREDEIYHFLLPDAGMASSATIKLLKDAHPAEAARVSEWRKGFCEPIRQDEYALLQQIAKAIDALLLEHYAIQKNIGLITEANNEFFGNENATLNIDFQSYSYEQKEKFARERLKPNAPYYKLKQIMDYWCSLWFWDIRAAKELPTRRQWYEDLAQILNIDLGKMTAEEQTDDEPIRDYRKDKKQLEKQLVEALRQSTSSLFTNERAALVKQYADQYRFFHYELEFIEVFRENNGFDLIAGNPPWVNIEADLSGVLSETNPEIYTRGLSAAEVARMSAEIFRLNSNLRESYKDELILIDSMQTFMGASQNYSLLKGQKNNLYRAVIVNVFSLLTKNGFSGIIHPDTVYEDSKAFDLRLEIYQRLRYHFHFRNGLSFFEIGHKKSYSINIMSGTSNKPNFYSIVNLYHPKTIDGCFIHDGHGSAGGITKTNTEGRPVWNLEPHKNRIINITKNELQIFALNFEGDINLWAGVKLPSIHSNEIMIAINSFSSLRCKVGNYGIKIIIGFDEGQALKKNLLFENFKKPDYNRWDIILSGPNFFVSNPLNKSINSKGHYDLVDLTEITTDFLPNTPFHFRSDKEVIIEKFGVYNGINTIEKFRLLVSRMLDSKTERTLQSSIIPPRFAHLNSCNSIVFNSVIDLLEVSGIFSSLVFDFYIRATGATNLTDSIMKNFGVGVPPRFKSCLFNRTLQLNCLNKFYQPLWEDSFDEIFVQDSWSVEDSRLKPFTSLTKEWTWHTPLRNYFERRMALVEIDVITAMALGLGLEELTLIYNVQFPVLQQNEEDTWYDAKGNIVFTCSKGLLGVGLDRSDWDQIRDMKEGETYTHTITKSELYQGQQVIYYAPFTKCDRVEDYKRAWAHFEQRFNKE